MTAALRSRVNMLAQRSRPAGRVIVVQPSLLGGDPIERTTSGYLLRVPFETDADPMAALTEEQHALIGPDDRVITVCYVEDWRGDPGA